MCMTRTVDGSLFLDQERLGIGPVGSTSNTMEADRTSDRILDSFEKSRIWVSARMMKLLNQLDS